MAEGRHITSLLQLETDLIDAAGSVDGKHELEIHIFLRQRWDAPRTHQQRAKERCGTPQRTVHLVRARAMVVQMRCRVHSVSIGILGSLLRVERRTTRSCL